MSSQEAEAATPTPSLQVQQSMETLDVQEEKSLAYQQLMSRKELWKKFRDWRELTRNNQHSEALTLLKELRGEWRDIEDTHGNQAHLWLIEWNPFKPWKTLPKTYDAELQYNPDLKMNREYTPAQSGSGSQTDQPPAQRPKFSFSKKTQDRILRHAGIYMAQNSNL